MTFFNKLEKGIGSLSRLMVYFGGICLVFMMAATMADVIIRTCGGSIIGVYEISETLMVPIVFFALPYVELFGGHAEVDLFYNRFPKILQKIFSVLTNIGACFYNIVMVRYCIIRIGKMAATGEHSALLHIPYTLLYVLICIGAIVAIAAIVVRTIRIFLPTEKEAEE